MPDRGRVLVIDDDEAVRRVIGDLLEDEGYEVRRAADGRAGLDQLTNWLPDVIVLDLMMPTLDGWNFRAEQRRQPGPASEVPIVVISAVRDLRAAAAGLDAAALIAKPFDLDEVAETIERVLAQRLAC